MYVNGLCWPPLCKKTFDHNFWTKALRKTILVSRSMFLRSRNPLVPFVLTCDLDLSRSWLLQNHILDISVVNGQNELGLDFNKLKVSWVVWTCDLCECITLTTIMQKDVFDPNFELRHFRWWVWRLDLCFWGQGIRWCHLLRPMALTFPKLHFGPYLKLLRPKHAGLYKFSTW